MLVDDGRLRQAERFADLVDVHLPPHVQELEDLDADRRGEPMQGRMAFLGIEDHEISSWRRRGTNAGGFAHENECIRILDDMKRR